MITNEDVQNKNYLLSSEETKDILQTIKATGEVTEAYSTTWFRVFLREADTLGLEQADAVLYPMVKEVVLDGIDDPLERNRLTSFHRVAKHLVKKALALNGPTHTLWTASALAHVNKSDVIREWNRRTKPTIDPVMALRVDFQKLLKRANTLSGEGIDISDFNSDVQEYVQPN